MRYAAVIAVLFAATLVAAPALARHPWGGGGREMRGPEMRGLESRGRLDRFLPDIRRHHPGRLLDVEPGWGPRGEPHNRIKWLTPDGRVIWFDQDARTGEFHGETPPPPYPYDRWR
jgi:hypothetical protein